MWKPGLNGNFEQKPSEMIELHQSYSFFLEIIYVAEVVIIVKSISLDA
jgi:hypothetical protein